MEAWSALAIAAGSLTIGGAVGYWLARSRYEGQYKALETTFKALSADSLRDNNRVFLDLAAQTFAPIRETLERFDDKVGDLERARIEAYSGIKVSVADIARSHDKLRSETENLVRALRAPQIKGRWGELQLRRVVEMAGMLAHCDFTEQVSVDSDEGRLRPDLVVNLPGGKTIVVDSKAVITAYLEAMQSEDEAVKRAKLSEHARHIRGRVAELSRKNYWEQFAHSPEFVVLFLPGESFFSAALEADPSLIEQSIDQRVILATPTTLIALLKAVSYGWKQAALAENAREISTLGKTLYSRIASVAEHFETMGSRLGGAVESYNKAMASLESRVLVTARQFRDMKVSDEELAIIEPIETVTREIPQELR